MPFSSKISGLSLSPSVLKIISGLYSLAQIFALSKSSFLTASVSTAINFSERETLITLAPSFS